MLNAPELKMVKPSDTHWLSRERAVHAVHQSLPALVTTFEEIYNKTGDTEAHEIATLLNKYNTVACIYMLSDVLHTVAKLHVQGSLQGKEVDLASVPGMVRLTGSGRPVGSWPDQNFCQAYLYPARFIAVT